jgi:phosphotransferase system HPr-like phosphotransfer protein
METANLEGVKKNKELGGEISPLLQSKIGQKTIDDFLGAASAREITVRNSEVVDNNYSWLCLELIMHYPSTALVGDSEGRLFDASIAKNWEAFDIGLGKNLTLYALNEQVNNADSALYVMSKFLDTTGREVPHKDGKIYFTYDFEIRGDNGLHMRPAVVLIDSASEYKKNVMIYRPSQTVINRSGESVKYGEQMVDAKSIMQLTMLAAIKGTRLNIMFENPSTLKENKIKNNILLNVYKVAHGHYG